MQLDGQMIDAPLVSACNSCPATSSAYSTSRSRSRSAVSTCTPSAAHLLARSSRSCISRGCAAAAVRRAACGLLTQCRLHGGAPSWSTPSPPMPSNRAAWPPLPARTRTCPEPTARRTHINRLPVPLARSSSQTRRPLSPVTLNAQTPNDSTATRAPTTSARTSLPHRSETQGRHTRCIRSVTILVTRGPQGTSSEALGKYGDEFAQAHGRVGVHVPDPAGGCS